MKEIKLIDIAREAGVSPATVSRIVRKSGYVSDEKRLAVEKIMAEKGYVLPEPESSGSPQVLLIFPHHHSPLFDSISMHMGKALQKMGWQLIVHYSFETRAEELIPVIDDARRGDLRGVVFNCCGDSFDFTPIRSYLTSLPFPAIMLERAPEIYGLSKVMLDAAEMLYIAVEYLARYGHDRILYIGRDCDFDTERKRLSGFRAGLRAMDIAGKSAFISVRTYDRDNGYAAFSAYAAENGLPSAVIAPDQVLMGVMNYLYEKGCRVPEDISLVGLDDTYASLASPPLTSVAFPVAEIAQSAVQILSSYSDSATPRSILLSTRLTERSSVSHPKTT